MSFRQYLITVICLFTLIGVVTFSNFNFFSNQQSEFSDCELSTQPCVIDVGQFTGTISLGHLPLEVETENSIIIKTNGQLEQLSAKIVGLNMNMGFVPIHFTQMTDNSWRGHFMLAACTEPNMIWQLVIEGKSDGKPFTYLAILNS